MKKPWASCKTQEEKLRYYQVASHESFAAANADLAKQHGVAQGRAKALAEARAQFQSEKRKAESIATRFAKRQAAMLEYESCLANSPLKPQKVLPQQVVPQQHRQGMEDLPHLHSLLHSLLVNSARIAVKAN